MSVRVQVSAFCLLICNQVDPLIIVSVWRLRWPRVLSLALSPLSVPSEGPLSACRCHRQSPSSLTLLHALDGAARAGSCCRVAMQARAVNWRRESCTCAYLVVSRRESGCPGRLEYERHCNLSESDGWYPDRSCANKSQSQMCCAIAISTSQFRLPRVDGFLIRTTFFVRCRRESGYYDRGTVAVTVYVIG